MSVHIPVLLRETLAALQPQSGEFFIDGTFGGGGHAEAIMSALSEDGRLLAVDWNTKAIEAGKQKHANDQRWVWVHGNFGRLAEILHERELPPAHGLFLDLGVSSDELEKSGRGFSFRNNEPLLMTYDDSQTPVHQILEELPEEALAEIIRQFGEERRADVIAEAICRQRRKQPITTTKDLADCVAAAVPSGYERGRIHPATRTFQALRIYANSELENLERVLRDLPRILRSGGRAAVISFHSLEDRVVKHCFQRMARSNQAALITKKPARASPEETARNPRARSAKLRAINLL